jgi:hypothetical protein
VANAFVILVLLGWVIWWLFKHSEESGERGILALCLMPVWVLVLIFGFF